MKKLIIFSSILFTCLANGQDISCNDLLDFITEEAYEEDSVGSIRLMDSSWLNGVEAYSYDGNLFVIANIKSDEISYRNKEYIFCGVPEENWKKFSTYKLNKSYGEDFHEYIMDYQCNCY